jgi:hypothetical protein
LTPQRAAGWEKIRGKGKYRFIFLKCAIGAGGLAALVTTLTNSFALGHFDWIQFILGFLTLPIGGAVGGMLLWDHFEARYRSYQNHRESEHLQASQSTPPSKP